MVARKPRPRQIARNGMRSVRSFSPAGPRQLLLTSRWDVWSCPSGSRHIYCLHCSLAGSAAWFQAFVSLARSQPPYLLHSPSVSSALFQTTVSAVQSQSQSQFLAFFFLFRFFAAVVLSPVPIQYCELKAKLFSMLCNETGFFCVFVLSLGSLYITFTQWIYLACPMYTSIHSLIHSLFHSIGGRNRKRLGDVILFSPSDEKAETFWI